MNNECGGIINVYKPVGMTSFGVVSKIRKLTGIKKVGHCGTLDPFAEGVLPICIGKATSAVQFMDKYDKKYRVNMVFGNETDTQDCTGTVISTNLPTQKDLQEMQETEFATLKAVIKSFIGPSEQLPPMYSAIKMNGKPLYEYAREGIEIERKKRNIFIYDAILIEASADGELKATVDIHCSKGTYIRTICVDIGAILKFGAYANSLIRTGCGPFKIENSVTLDELGDILKLDIEQKLQTDSNPLSDFSLKENNNTLGNANSSKNTNLTEKTNLTSETNLTGKSNLAMEIFRKQNICLPVEFALSYMDKIFLDKEQTLKIIQGQKIVIEAMLPDDVPILTFCGENQFIGITKKIKNQENYSILSAERIFVDVEDYK